MRLSILIGWSLLAFPLSAAEQGRSFLRFVNLDQLSGSLVSFGGDRLVWEADELVNPSPFWVRSVLELNLPTATPAHDADHEATITMARGDNLRGQLASVTDSLIELDTWYAGRLRIPRKWVRDIRVADRPKLLFRGPAGLAGWEQSTDPPAWKFRANGFQSDAPGGIGKDFDLPDEFRLVFNAQWRDSFIFKLALFSNDPAGEKTTAGYELMFNQRSVNLRKAGQNNGIGQSSRANELQENDHAKIEIRASARTKVFCFLVDDRLIGIWRDPDMAREQLGRGINLIAQNNQPIRISNIEIAEWDGDADETPVEEEVIGGFGDLEPAAQTAPKPPTSDGRMVLRNGDSIAGEVISILNGKIAIKTSYGEVKLPVSRLRNVSLKPAELEEPKRNAGDVRAWFSDGTSTVFRLERLDGDTITGTSQNFGTATFKTSAFNRIEFNIYDRKLAGIRAAEEW